MSRLSPAASLAWKIAAAEAGSAGHPAIEPAHLVIGALSLEKVGSAEAEKLGVGPEQIESLRRERATVAELVQGLGTDTAAARRLLRRAVGRGGGSPPGPLSRSPAAKAAFAAAGALAGSGPITLLHLLAALADQPDQRLGEGLSRCGIAARELAARARAYAGVVASPQQAGPAAAVRAVEEAVSSATPTLDRYGRDLTALARRGELPPLVGRRDELLAVVQTLARASKANPLLVGDPGVGKTAIVEALALRAAAGKDQAVLGGRRIVELSLGALLAGTDYRGELEKRLTLILDELAAHPEILVFVDEVHTLVGAGRVGSAGPDVASLVKPALARGELRLIGATTPVEYRQQIEADTALARRFEKIDVPEPDQRETLAILTGLRPRWQSHHGVRIADDALEAAIALAERFLPERRRPDKAIDLVDRAAARARLPQLSMKAGEPLPGTGDPLTVDARLVALAFAERSGLPVELVVEGLDGGARARVASLEAFLKERLVGQDAVVERVARRVRLAHSGLAARRGPLAVFLFLGPTGVGKTELARLLAEHLFGSAAELVRFDMSEYMEQHAVARLLGAPPGYVGHEEEGQLTRALRAKPYAVVLLDEVEKAQPRIFDVFLQVFDAGQVTDAQGRSADARHAVFVMTSNLGQAASRERLGFTAAVEPAADAAGADKSGADAAAAEAALGEARRFFRAELLNRIDEILVFRPLDLAALRRILRPLLARLVETVRERHGRRVEISEEAEEFIARRGASPEQGARELVRTVERLVETPLSGLMVSGKLEQHAVWRLVYDEGGVYWLGAD